MLPTIPRGSKSHLLHLMKVIRAGVFHVLSSVNIASGFRKTGTWPIQRSEIYVTRLFLGKDIVNSRRQIDIGQLSVRLGPEARPDMREPVVLFGSVSTRGIALEAASPAVLQALTALDAEAYRKQAAKNALQAARDAKAVAAIAQDAPLEAEAVARRSSWDFGTRKASLQLHAERTRATTGPVDPYLNVSGAVVKQEPRRERKA